MTTNSTAGYEAVNAKSKYRENYSKPNRKSHNFLPTLVAVSGACGLAAMPVNALELGEVQVNSTIGHPLRASIAYALNPDEQIHDYCIYLRPTGSKGGLPTLSNAKISLTNNAIVLTGNVAIREPILGMQIAIDCAYTPNLVREYTVLLSPELPVVQTRSLVEPQPVAQGAAKIQPLQPVAEKLRPDAEPVVQNTASKSGLARPAIAANSRYRVIPGDNLSTIVSRITDRKIGLSPAVKMIFAANPDAFTNQDINRLIAGSELVIPNLLEETPNAAGFAANSPAFENDEPEIVGEMIGDVVEADLVTMASETEPPTATIAYPAVTTGTRPASSLTDETVDEEVTTLPTKVSELRPGDVIIAPAEPHNAERIIPGPTSDDSSDIVPVVRSATANNVGTSGAWNWLLWLVGTGVALIIGLLLFGRTVRERFGPVGLQTTEAPRRRQNDASPDRPRIIDDVDFEFEDTINAAAISLDADLGAGTGLNPGAEMHVAQDFGYSADGQLDSELDLEITEESAREPEVSPTDIIPPNHREQSVTVVESEELPTNDDSGEYDLSMIVDATKQPIGDYDATAKDLQAVRVDAIDTQEDDYTTSGEIDYHTLEQDYQEEFTATQAANAEIEKVAMELARRIEEEEDGGNVTAEMPGQSHRNEQAVTSSMPTVSNPDNTAELTANLLTTIDAENDAVADDRDSEITVEMSAAGSDITIDLPFDSARSKVRKKQK
jgi:hypothetical protein